MRGGFPWRDCLHYQPHGLFSLKDFLFTLGCVQLCAFTCARTGNTHVQFSLEIRVHWNCNVKRVPLPFMIDPNVGEKLPSVLTCDEFEAFAICTSNYKRTREIYS